MLPSAPTAGTLDSTSVPVHKHAAGAPEKTAGKRSAGHASVDDEDLFGGGVFVMRCASDFPPATDTLRR